MLCSDRPDLASGRKDHRPGLEACLKALQPGNTLVVWKLDRLGRDLRHLVSMVDDLRARGVGLKVVAPLASSERVCGSLYLMAVSRTGRLAKVTWRVARSTANRYAANENFPMTA